jgi:beta-glucanase (GH16 family)
MKQYIHLFLTALLMAFSGSVSSQTYKLVWEDNFNGTTLDSSKWNVEQKIGVWNTGSNHEFQHYKKENVTVGSDGSGNNCLILKAKKEEYNGYHFTSGRVNTKGKFAFKRGKLEASIKIPDLANGLWPAFWTLGYTPTGWPDCGEIDVLEMGHAAGITAGKQNSYIGSHLFWGPYPRDFGNNYTAVQNLSSGFFKHTVVWTETQISVYFNDSSTPYFSMGINGSDTEEFRNFQDYIIFNLAVGGSVPNITDISKITATFPASMYVDWVKVYQETEDFKTTELPLFGTFGIFEEGTGTDMRMDLGYDLFENKSGATAKTGETPKNGTQVLSYNIQANNDFNMKLTSGIPRNMANYSNGSVQFYQKTNSPDNFQFGVSDTSGKEAFITISNESAQKIVRDGSWQLVYIPLAEIAGSVNLAALKEMLIVKGNSTANSYFAIDEVIYSETAPVSGVYGIYSNNPAISDKFALDNVNGNLYIWENTIAFITTLPAFEGKDVISFRSTGAASWWGFGLNSKALLNLENYAKGYLHLALRTKSTQPFKIVIEGANSSIGEVTFLNGADPFGFVRDGIWHQLTIPVSNLVAQGLNLSACGNIFTMTGSAIGDIAVDDIYLSESASVIENTATCHAASISVTPKNPTIKTGVKKKFTAAVTDQFGKPTDATVTWESNGGTILQDGNFSTTEPGSYIVKARFDNLSDSTKVTVSPSNGINSLEAKTEISYSFSSKELQLKGLSNNCRVEVYNLLGVRVYKGKTNSADMKIDMNDYAPSTYIIKIANSEEVEIRKIVTY